MTVAFFTSLDEVRARAGEHIGYSDWHEITQERINSFADATDDHQWIHCDPERAKSGPFGHTIAQGYLTLCLAVPLLNEIFQVTAAKLVINYGLNKVRFPAPVPVGSRLRLGAVLSEVQDVPGGVQAVIDATFEIEGGSKPVCVAEILLRDYVGDPIATHAADPHSASA
jgi:acyl dehydratase